MFNSCIKLNDNNGVNYPIYYSKIENGRLRKKKKNVKLNNNITRSNYKVEY